MRMMVQLRLREKVTIDRSRSTVVVLLMTFHIANCTKTKLSAALRRSRPSHVIIIIIIIRRRTL